LADLSAEPRKLTFAEVHANYEKVRQASSKKWGLYLIIGIVGIASALVGSYLYLTPKTSDQLAQNSVSQESPASQNTIQSVGTTSEDKFIERADRNTTTTDNNSSEAKANESANALRETVAKNNESSAKIKEERLNESSVKENSLTKIEPTTKSEKNTNNERTSGKKKNSENKLESKTKTVSKKRNE